MRLIEETNSTGRFSPARLFRPPKGDVSGWRTPTLASVCGRGANV